MAMAGILLTCSATAQTVESTAPSGVVQYCRESKTFAGTNVNLCETKQVVVNCKQDSLVVYYRNGYTSDELINGKVCQVYHPPVVKKQLVFVPVYEFITICREERTGDQIKEVYTDCN
jgi:hypothetical protein